MNSELHTVLRFVHIFLGSAGFLLGAAAILLPKFSSKSAWHRWVGRAYAVAMIGMSLVSIPLAIWNYSIFLLVIGLLTFGWVVAGWLALRAIRARMNGQRVPASSRLRWHVTLMGSSYIAAWTAFLVNVRPAGDGVIWMIAYSIIPSIIGSYLIARTTTRLSNPARMKAARVNS